MADQHAVAPGHADSAAPEASLPDAHGKANFWTLTLGAIGVVYGDIGTSPLYAMRETIAAATGGHHGTPVPMTRELVIGILSLLLWALVLTVTIKYVILLLRADNKGEGGSLTLVALAQRALGRRNLVVLVMGMAGAALFYGDAAMTPAISVLSAVEGLKLVTPALDDYILPIAVVILVGLFIVQSRGTGKVAAFFGPLTLLWFITMAVLGLVHISDDWGVFLAVNPYYGVSFLVTHPGIAFAVLGSVCLAVTGAEALYADLGHFGRTPIRMAWGTVVFPALALNYLGQGALLLAHPDAVENPFFLLAPDWLLLPLVILATLATIVASQAVITGAFSLTRQAVQLGLLPRLEVRFTSETHQGQIYLPRVNWLLLFAVVSLVLMFGSSSSLASAYGIAVFGTMVGDDAARLRRHEPKLGLGSAQDRPHHDAAPGHRPRLPVVEHAEDPGRRLRSPPDRGRLLHPDADLGEGHPHPVREDPQGRRAPDRARQHAREEPAPSGEGHRRLPHQRSGHRARRPPAQPETQQGPAREERDPDRPQLGLSARRDEERVRIEHVGDTFWRVQMTYGYMETPNIPRGLAILRKQGFKFDIMATSFFLSRRSIRPAAHSGMPLWQDRIFISLAKSASDATDFFQIPTGRVVEVGTQVTV